MINDVLRRANPAIRAGGVLAAAGLAVVFGAQGAGAQTIAHAPGHGGGKPSGGHPGDNGTVKIHRSTTPQSDRRNEPHVCVFYLDAFGFDPAQSVTWQIKSWPPTGDRAVVASGALALDSHGDGRTADMTLQNGHYKLFWNFTGEHGFAKQKVFWVKCPAPTQSPSPTPTGSSSPAPTMTPTPTGSPSPAATTPSPAPTSAAPAPAPTPVQASLPVTG